ncbi:MAG: flagellar basal-body rod protein FlgG [Gemmatimonadaceae bacterium]|nr:flagellar basal-body rod protein FlgG [Gemmatimonadaceae bacterium]
MDPALRTAATGMMAQQLRTEVIANNLANVNTTAFKRSRAHFVDLLYQTIQAPSVVAGHDAGVVPAIQVGRGTRLAGVQRLETQGALEQTNRTLDLAINGDGYFQVQLPSGQVAYTRDGSFHVSDQGMLSTSEGYAVAPGIQIPPDAANIAISPAGIVTCTPAQSTQPVELGTIELARFLNPAGLQALGSNLYQATPASGEPAAGLPLDEGLGQIEQGYLESSNVEVVQEMVDMISAMRAYEITSKAVKNSESMAEIANNLIR